MSSLDGNALDGDDLVFYSDSNNEIHSGGFSINSIMMNLRISNMTHIFAKLMNFKKNVYIFISPLKLHQSIENIIKII